MKYCHRCVREIIGACPKDTEASLEALSLDSSETKLMLIVMNYNSFDKIIIYEFMSRTTISCRTISAIKCGKNDRCRELPLGGTIIVLIVS